MSTCWIIKKNYQIFQNGKKWIKIKLNLHMLCKKEVLERPKGLLYFLLSLRFPTASRLQRLQKIFDDVLMQEIWMKMKSYFSVLRMYFKFAQVLFHVNVYLLNYSRSLPKTFKGNKWSKMEFDLHMYPSSLKFKLTMNILKRKKKDTICPFFSRLSKYLKNWLTFHFVW